MKKKALHLLSQRLGLTGSGITLLSFVDLAAEAGWDQTVSVAVPSSEKEIPLLARPGIALHPLIFETSDLPLPIPGMSDVMPYESSCFSGLSGETLERYRTAWRQHLEGLAREGPFDVIHTHHLWIMSALVKDVFPDTRVVNHCHGTGLRQMELCPHLATEVREGCRRNDAFLVLHETHRQQVHERLDVALDRIHVVGAGYGEEVFYSGGGDTQRERRLLYAGKYAYAKGLPQLLDAFSRFHGEHPDWRLHLAGSGTGPEADEIFRRIEEMGAAVVNHGRLEQTELAALMRTAHTFVLPSYFEGLPLVLVEAFASGCRLVSTDLTGIQQDVAPHLGSALRLVEMPPLISPDVPKPDAVAAFVDRLYSALEASCALPPLEDPAKTMPEQLVPFTWRAVFDRVLEAWETGT